jgi:ferritin-like metal-binding protein YciE
LKKTLEQHLAVTQKQRTRLDEVKKLVSIEQDGNTGGESKGFLSGLFEAISSGGEKCKGMEGIITEGQKILKADMDPDVKDAAIIACAQKIEHYEICGYGTARAYAMELDLKEAERLLQETLGEEYEADDRLTQLAYAGINEKAEIADDESAGKNNKGLKKAVPAKKAKQPQRAGNSAETKKVSKKTPSTAADAQLKKAPVKAAATKVQPKKTAAKKSAVKK